MIRIEAPDRIADMAEIESAIREYLVYVQGVFGKASGTSFDIDRLTDRTVGNIDAYLPPRGRTYLARKENGALVGMVYVKMIGADCAEIKRLYVRPAGRRQGLGRRLAERAMAAAREIGATRVHLDTLAVMGDARALYEGLGFRYVDAYPESEIDEEHRKWAVFMGRDL